MVRRACKFCVGAVLMLVGCASPSDAMPAGPGRPALPTPATPATETTAPGAAASASPAAVTPEPAAAVEVYEPRPEDVIEPKKAIGHPERLAGFFDALTALDHDGGDRIVRVVHLGASIIGADHITSMLREKFQARFGDGGAGLVLMQRYMSNYMHRSAKLSGSGWDYCYIAYLCKKDGHYGLGGVTFSSTGGASTRLATRSKAPGMSASHFELWYAADKGGGRIEFRLDDAEPVLLDTRASALEDRFHVVDATKGAHEVLVRARGRGKARAYGIVMENASGVVWDQFSMLGAFTKRLSAWDPDHIGGQIKQRDPELVVFTYGGNDSRRVTNGKLTQAKYVKEFTDVVNRVRAGKPEMSCLIVTPTDRARSLKFKIDPAHMQVLVDAQLEAAEKTDCAVFDMYDAMGRGGSLLKWRKTKPPLAAPDLKHLNHAGRTLMADWMYDSLIAAYVEHRKAAATGS